VTAKNTAPKIKQQKTFRENSYGGKYRYTMYKKQ